MRDFLFQTGAIFLLASCTVLLVGLVDKSRRREHWDFDDIVRGLGYAAVVSLLLPAIGLVLLVLNLPIYLAHWLTALT